MTKDLSVAVLIERKTPYKAPNRGDNAMAMEDELRSELAQALAEKMAPADADFDESGCVGEMKKLYASGCAKHEMFKKVQDEYGCDKGKFKNYLFHTAVKQIPLGSMDSIFLTKYFPE